MPNANALLSEYSESHQNRTNKLIHWFAVPSIYWSVFALIWSLPSPSLFPPWLNWAVLAMLVAQIYYLMLSAKIGWLMLVFNLLVWASVRWLAANVETPIWIIALVVFVVAWVFQFIGHKVEGKKPSFFRDVVFLLVGPAWCANFLLGRHGVQR